MINRTALLSDLQKLLQRLEADLLERSESADVPEVGKTLRAEYDRAKTAERTAQNYEDWRTDAITQAAAAWVLSCVFVRFLEDNRLIDPPKIAGPVSASAAILLGVAPQPENRLQRARDEHELYFRAHPKQTDREYLLAVFDELANLPGTKDVFGEHNPIRELPNWLSGDAAGEVLRFFQKIDANSGVLVHDFTDPNWDTRFLGDLYQDLSEAARKKYALLQTPEFVEGFILDRTLDPAIDEFGLEGFKMIDPACGSGHFLLGAFRRIENRWERKAPDAKCREVVQWTLDSIFGVDVNPFAVAIARFRLLLAALRTCGVLKLADSPAFHINLVCGDSLLHAPLSGGQQVLDFELAENSDECDHAYQSENLPELKRLLRGGQYHAVVANPPYITPKDRQLNERYRKRFRSCHKQYSLAVPFFERVFGLAASGGFTGQITANSFMKREFGKKLIQEILPAVDLTHVIDISGAHIPGHGTPTVIIFGRNRKPVAGDVRAVLGIQGELVRPEVPSHGPVWRSIVENIDVASFENYYITVKNISRDMLSTHPWSLAGGGASDLREFLESRNRSHLGEFTASIGYYLDAHEDEAFMQPVEFPRRHNISEGFRNHVRGENIRDWSYACTEAIVFPYDQTFAIWSEIPRESRWAWFHQLRTVLWSRSVFGGGTYRSAGRPWYEFHQFPKARAASTTAIVYGFFATHNHFALNRAPVAFSRSAPLILLPGDVDEGDYLSLLALLNSSVMCFWSKQVFHDKGGGGMGGGLASEKWERFYEYTGTLLQRFPLPADRPLLTARLLDILATRARDFQPASIAAHGAPTRAALITSQDAAQFARSQMIACQEELDWECYRLYGLIEEDLTQRREGAKEGRDQEKLCASAPLREPPPLSLGQRAFEIVLARKMAAGETQTTWFERHGSTPITELPAEWPDDYRQLVERRIALIESDPNIRLIEQPEYKRRWNTEPWDSQLERALRQWLLDRLESYFDFDGRMKAAERQNLECGDLSPLSSAAEPLSVSDGTPLRKQEKESGSAAGQSGDKSPQSKSPLAEIALVSIAKLADVARQDAEFQQVGELYRDDPAFDVQALVTELVAAECVPLLPVLRYKDSGLRKRVEWEKTWEMQREEDRRQGEGETRRGGDKETRREGHGISPPLSAIPVPPKYTSADFISTGGARYWSLRGKLDVPKERWISFPHCEGPDGTLVIAWAGYDHLQQARAISAYYVRVQTEFGGSDDARLIPLLACLIELLPWLKQWHNEPDAAYDGMRMGDYFEGFVNEEARQLNQTISEIKAWTPPAKTGRRGRK